MKDYLLNLLNQVDIKVLIPAFILAAIFLLLVYVLRKAQRRRDFDIAGFLRDEKGKESSMRATALVALGVTSWGFATLIFMGLMTPEYFLYYNLTWANALVLKELASKWNGAVPFAPRQQDPGAPFNQ